MRFYKPLISYILLLFLMTGCSFGIKNPWGGSSASHSSSPSPVSTKPSSKPNLILAAEKKATPQGRKVLSTGRKMIENELILPGGCWDYINEVYNRAGYPNTRQKRKTVFKGTKNKGPYVNVSLIQPGDFLYYINHSYGDIEHSGIFVDWVDFKNKEAMILSYGGENRRQPARYLPYDLSHVYNIIRATN